MKANYQKNMLVANLIVFLMVGVMVAGFYLFDRPANDITVIQNPRLLDTRIVVNDSTIVSHDTTRSARRSLPNLNPYARQHDGFLGFVRLEPTRSVPEPVTIPQPIYTEDELNDIADPDIVSYALVEGTDTGIFLPESFLTPPKEAKTQPVDRPVELVHKEPPEVPPIAEMNHKEGYVEVLMIVDTDGKPGSFSCRAPAVGVTDGPLFELDVVLKNNQRASLQFYVDAHNNDLQFLIVEESPKEYYFAKNLIKVLPEWRFKPAIRDGMPVESFVLVQYWFCLPDNPACQELLLQTSPT